jgi:hypothetical protein
MNTKMTMIYWKSDRFWLGKLLEHPEIMTQGETLDELGENIRDAYRMMAMGDGVGDDQTKEISLWNGRILFASSEKRDLL